MVPGGGGFVRHGHGTVMRLAVSAVRAKEGLPQRSITTTTGTSGTSPDDKENRGWARTGGDPITNNTPNSKNSPYLATPPRPRHASPLSPSALQISAV